MMEYWEDRMARRRSQKRQRRQSGDAVVDRPRLAAPHLALPVEIWGVLTTWCMRVNPAWAAVSSVTYEFAHRDLVPLLSRLSAGRDQRSERDAASATDLLLAAMVHSRDERLRAVPLPLIRRARAVVEHEKDSAAASWLTAVELRSSQHRARINF